MAVSARFLFSNPLETFVLSVILQFAVEAVFSIPVGIVSWSGVVLVVVGVPFVSCTGRGIGCVVGKALLLVIFLPLKSGNLIFLVFRLHSCDGLLNFGTCLPLSVRSDLVHVVQGHVVRVPLRYNLAKFRRQCCPE